MVVKIRQARKADIRIICELICAFSKNSLPTEEEVARALRRWENNIRDNPDYRLLAAELDGEVVGTAMLHRQHKLLHYGPGSHLEDLIVDPAHQGQGIGTHLWNEIVRIATEEWQCHKVMATVSKSAGFYKKLGCIQTQVEMRFGIAEQLTEEEDHERQMLYEQLTPVIESGENG